jgi:hypothetical protein
VFNDCRNLFHVISNGGQLAGEQRRRREHHSGKTNPSHCIAEMHAVTQQQANSMSPSLANFKLKSGVHTIYKNPLFGAGSKIVGGLKNRV